MKAVLCKEHGEPSVLVVEEVAAPEPGPKEVRVAVHAAGINFFDILQVAGTYQVKPPFPFSPGGESAGAVIEVGAEVTGISPGDRVIANHPWGGFAEEVVVAAERLTPLPDGMSYEHGATFPVVYGTSYHALVQRAELAPGETLLVHGAAGGVGLTAVQIGKLMGARVIAAAGSAAKLETAKAHGADELINYREENLRDRVKALTEGKGADVIYDPVGGDVMDQSVRCINWGGRILVIGFASGRIAEVPTNLVLLKGFSLVGVFWGSFCAREPEQSGENFRTLLGWYAEGKLKPHISATYPLEGAAEALMALKERKITGKAVLVTGRG